MQSWWDAMRDRVDKPKWIALASVCVFLLAPAAGADEAIDFSRHIRPILAERCLHCHGPDAQKRQADLRLDELASATADRGGSQVIAPGKPEASTLLERVQSDDPEVQMPPPDAGQRRLTSGEIDLLRRWIAQGATWSEHWSFAAPRRPSLPTVRDANWPRNGIDSFILSRLDQEGLHPSAPANSVGLLRRVTLDLTGLPPTIEEVESFLADDSPDAYEKVVERLLSSPRYGEHMALAWLDAARYADTSGYQADWERFMWPWRDWVVGAYNANLPFDQFTVEQLAGDLLPDATPSQVLATGFNRNHRINDEGGSLDAEFEVEYVVDRVDTTSTVWLGLTAGCARCHDHKYDPISQKEYYRLYAFFNNVPEKGIDGRHGAAKPFIEVPNPAVQSQVADLKRRLETQQQTLAQFAEGAPERESAAKEIAEIEAAIKKLEPRAVTPVQVMQELPERRPTYLLVRGVYDQPDTREQLTPGLPSILGGLPDERPADRLALARWLVSPENTLTARVTANRLWQHHFGAGLVRTPEDFGSRGERPTHPELLDWLATELVRLNWDMKAFHRLVVTSSAYRQASYVTPELLNRDPDNRLLARGPRRRLSGAAIRDQALFVGGLLSGKTGGPPVKPYQPAGLWEELSFGNGKTSVDFYVQDHGESLYRRSLYTFWKRTVAPPSMAVFDGGGREMCRVSVELTNTPLQALTLQNDITFLEAARHLARRMLLEGGPAADDQLTYGWRTVLTRMPSSEELNVLRRSLERYRSVYRNDMAAAEQLLSAGESARDARLDAAEHAAMTMVAHTLLNLDEAIVLE
jgi:hypothetical protein